MLLASTILMVRPAAFGYNEETARNNYFQSQPDSDNAELQDLARKEFDGMVDLLSKNGINVLVIEDDLNPPKPDAIFPNNWVSTFPTGEIAVFPLFAMSRRPEKRFEILDWIAEHYVVNDVQDWSEFEADARYLEGTGSMVIDHKNKLIFASLSERTHAAVLEKFASANGYSAITFHAVDAQQRAIYHTNVMMCLGDGFAVVCEDAIKDEIERIAVLQLLSSTSREIITIDLDQMNCFAGNMLQVMNDEGKKFLIMSETALRSLRTDQVERLERFGLILSASIPTIEKIEGGSARCMMAEIFLEKRL